MADELPDHDYLFELADKTAVVLETESEAYRPCGADGKPGGLLDFTLSGQKNLPLIVVPDLHARAYFLLHVLEYVLPEGFLPDGFSGITVLEALAAQAVRVVCVGDALHSEQRARSRWMQAWYEFQQKKTDGPAMTEEMKEGLALLSIIMECKCSFTENFHFLKGNHENIMNRRGHGDFPFCKFANEGEMVKLFMRDVYGDDVLMVISCFENALPLAAAFPNCVVSHAEPRRYFSRGEIISGRKDVGIVSGLTWTENDIAEEGSVPAMLKELTGSGDCKNARYIAGHRPVRGNYALRQNGSFVQIHNTEKQNVALVYTDRAFNPEKDIKAVFGD